MLLLPTCAQNKLWAEHATFHYPLKMRCEPIKDQEMNPKLIDVNALHKVDKPKTKNNEAIDSLIALKECKKLS